MLEPSVILVDKEDQELGAMPKMEAHVKGVLHRAISVFIITSDGDWIMQRRALSKYHSPGLWTNTCCSHPNPGESTDAAAHRRLMEEMGMECELEKLFDFIYKAEFDNNLIEHELDHVYFGRSDLEPTPNPDEVGEWKKVNFGTLHADVVANPQNYTPWFKIIYQKVQQCLLM